jgi:hypothetical protein
MCSLLICDLIYLGLGHSYSMHIKHVCLSKEKKDPLCNQSIQVRLIQFKVKVTTQEPHFLMELIRGPRSRNSEVSREGGLSSPSTPCVFLIFCPLFVEPWSTETKGLTRNEVFCLLLGV